MASRAYHTGRLSRDDAMAIIRRVSEETGVSPDRITSEYRGLPDAAAARDAVYAAMRATGASFPNIGRLLQRHPSSVPAGIRRHQRRAGER